jgi:hypothetical protein
MAQISSVQHTPSTSSSDSTPEARAAKATLDSLRALFALPDIQLIAMPASGGGAPAASLGSPTAFGAAWGDAFVGAGYQNRTRYGHLGDGAVSGGAGLGNPRRNIGIEITATSYSTLRQGFGTNGSASIKLHRVVNSMFGVAAGYENAMPWGHTDGGSSLYGVVSALIPVRADASKIFGGVGVSLGVGNARFRSERDVREHKDGWNAFGSMSFRVNDAITGVADWTGQDLNVGSAIRMPGPLPISLSVGLADVTHNAGDGARLIAGAGWAFRFQ